MLLVKFCFIEKTQKYIGWTMYNNGTYYASGDTLDFMIKNLHVNMRYHYGIDETYELDTKPSPQSEMPVRIMNKKFITTAISGGGKTKQTMKRFAKATGLKLLDRETLENNLRAMGGSRKSDEPIVKEKVEKPENAVYDYYESETVNGELVVYGIRRAEVARFKLAPTPKNDYTRPIEPSPFRPYQQPKLPAEPGAILANTMD